MFMLMPVAGFSYTKGTPKQFSRNDLENAVTREFCADCGTHVVTRPPGLPAVVLKVGTLDDPSLFGSPQMAIYTIDIKSGALKIVYESNDWLNHVQMSPTDPTLIMYCHEGPWHKVDRIWTIRTDGSNRKLMHERSMEMEIAGHEFFSSDGKTIWYDLQTPKYKVFWLAGVEIATGKRTRYSVDRPEWSVHFNISPDGKLFAGDGGGPNRSFVMGMTSKRDGWVRPLRSC